MKAIVLNKYRNELGKVRRKEYDSGVRDGECNRSAMNAFSCRSDNKAGTMPTMSNFNLLLEII